MERLIINVPNQKSAIVKQVLKDLGVIIQQEENGSTGTYKQELANISIWSDEDLKPIEDAVKAFESLKPQQW